MIYELQNPQDAKVPFGIYNCDIFAIEQREKEILSKYPDQVSKIKKAMELEIDSGKKEHEMTVDEVRLYKAKLKKERANKIYQEKKAEKI